MAEQHCPDPLLARSVIVTGTHYSTTTLVGALLDTASEFTLLHEPLNPRPTLSYDSLAPPRWYEYYPADRFYELQSGLASMLRRGPVLAQAVKRLGRVRSLRQTGQAVRYAQRRWPSVVSQKPAILKDPFLAFSALTLQQEAGLKVVWCLRHPGAFAESFLRKAGSFDFADLAAQPDLHSLLGGDADEVLRFASSKQSPVQQAALLWRVINGFGARYLLPDQRTMLVRQEQFAIDRDTTIRRLLGFAGGTYGRRTERFAARQFGSGGIDHQGASYIQRDPVQAANKWRNRLSPEDIAVLQAETAQLAAELGYDEATWRH